MFVVVLFSQVSIFFSVVYLFLVLFISFFYSGKIPSVSKHCMVFKLKNIYQPKDKRENIYILKYKLKVSRCAKTINIQIFIDIKPSTA